MTKTELARAAADKAKVEHADLLANGRTIDGVRVLVGLYKAAGDAWQAVLDDEDEMRECGDEADEGIALAAYVGFTVLQSVVDIDNT
jgi:hypothetical protein